MGEGAPGTKVLGLMSGTSLDGIDAVILDVAGGESGIEWEVVAFDSRPYSAAERDRIRSGIEAGDARELTLLDTTLGEWLAEAALSLMEGEGLSPTEVAAIGSHGQTIWHEPPAHGVRGSSLQIGCPATIAERTGVGVVSDFRAADLAAGGHGAPLVPWADRLLFSSPKCSRALQNLGGMGNVTWLPVRGSDQELLAFDTGPGVVLLDAAAELATNGAWTFDRDGELGGKGRVAEPVVDELMADPFFKEPPPRSTGREVFGPQLVMRLAERVGPGSDLRDWPDLLATLAAFTARSIGQAYRTWVLPKGVSEVYLTGGGAKNPVLRRAIQAELDPLPIRPGEELGMDPDAREAAAFALMAWAYLKDIPANIPSATGASGSRILGSWTEGKTGATGL